LPEAAARGAAPRADAGAWGLVGALTTIWGSSFFLIAVALDGGFAPGAVAAGRMSLAALALGLALAFGGARLPRLREWGWCALLGGVGLALPFVLLAWGQQSVPSGTAAIYIASVPLFVLLLARLAFGDAVGARRWIGFAIGLGGVAWLAGPSALAGVAEGSLGGQVACVAAAACYGCGAMIVRAMPPTPPLTATAGAHLAGAVLLLPLGLASLPEAAPTRGAAIALLSLGVLQTGLAQFLRYVAIRRAGPVFVSIVAYLIPIWAGFLGTAFLGEPLTSRVVVAYGMILVGVLIARPGSGG
jgi:drug/metabolite transporter (DMT)-like permease